MDERERHEKGTAKRRKVLGDAWVDRSIKRQTEFNRDFLDLISRYAWGEIWTRPGLDDRTRRFIVLGSMIALGRWEEFRLHLRAATNEGGFSKDDIKELLLQQAIYCGVPAANTAFHEAAHVFAEIEKPD
jgi:4-carboxymuconolactone decarboxylase